MTGRIHMTVARNGRGLSRLRGDDRTRMRWAGSLRRSWIMVVELCSPCGETNLAPRHKKASRHDDR